MSDEPAVLLADKLLPVIMQWSERWDVDLKDNEPYYDLLWSINEAIKNEKAA
jgi:hypothetical protein